jgi:hypothetical protein
VRSLAVADRALERIMHVAGGPEAFLEDHAVIVMSDHSQTSVGDPVNLAEGLGDWRVLTPSDPAPEEAELAVCPAARSAMVYLLDEDEDADVGRVAADLEAIDGSDLVIRRAGSEAVVRSPRGELRFAPDGELTDLRGRTWSVDGNHDVLGLSVADGEVVSATYPDAMGRLWSALGSPYAGDVLVSAAPGFEFVDWGGADHIGGGSHGSLLAEDSHGVLLAAGLELPERRQWWIGDVAPLVLRHFSVGCHVNE